MSSYEHIDRLLSECKAEGIIATVEISGKVSRGQLEDMIAAVASQFIVEVENISALKMLQELNFANVQAKWFMDSENFRDLEQITKLAESLGTKELIVIGIKPHNVKKSAPSRNDLEQTANFISAYEENPAEMKLSVDSCFSVLKALVL